MIHSLIRTWHIENKRIFLRADLNVSLHNGIITNDIRLQSILPTLDYLLNQNASVVLATHIGRPTHYDPTLSTQLLIPWFEKKGYAITFASTIHNIIKSPITAKQIILLENLRFFPGEKNNDPFFAQQLAQTASYYVNDALSVLHRNDCSVTLLPYQFSEQRRSIGFLVENELRILNNIKNNAQKPFLAILGGGKIDKIPLIRGLFSLVDTFIICPALCFSFLKAMKISVGKSLVDQEMFTTCQKIVIEAENRNKKIIFPLDYQISVDSINEHLSLCSAENFPDNGIGISVGPQTIKLIQQEIDKAKTIFFNCAMGFAYLPKTIENTKTILHAVAQAQGTTIVAGGDSIEMVYAAHVENDIDHISLGGGTTLAFLSGKQLPGLIPFKEQ